MLAALAAFTSASSALAQAPVVTGPAPAPVMPGAPVTMAAPGAPARDTTVRYQVERGFNVPIIVTGSILFIGGYAGALGSAWASDRPEYDQMYIPIAGPFMTLAERGTCSQLPCRGSGGEKVFLVADGMLQSVGLVMTIAGLVIPETRLVPVRVGSSSVRVQVAPSAGLGGTGLSAFGSF
jgi:hypothetical protein